ncbi:1-acyl-sn-glycerol-3-phosphate acyltransferase [Chaetoceros tenuissimus]|uniref:1-acyl-sn-glycerol-3-phosphate acyltransferase n=1 Tax=Chaetoceros tenuissimus TaxID=426638 RepID=A0AAD3CLR4_9STRA|nr:1-acyl-sn-glycerol-3-phosphate acyltransferase [Chaetoceros tenuissimus]
MKFSRACTQTFVAMVATSITLQSCLVQSFTPSNMASINKQMKIARTTLFASSIIPSDEQPSIGFENTCMLPRSEIHPIIKLKEGEPKEKFVNAHGLYCILVTIILNPIWAVAMWITDAVCKAFPDLDPNRAFYDNTGKVWSRLWLTVTDSYPTISGDVDRIRIPKNEEDSLGACLFVANHSSWLDIPILCTVLDPVFKFIAKGELKSIPCIGQQLVGGNHIMIDREDRRSQLRTFKEGVNYLKSGVPLMAFPEGKRSQDGRLDAFKGGIFSMAVKAGVPIVPISLSNTHAVMPSNALFPFQTGAGKLHVHVHEPIEVEGKSEAELAETVKEKLLSRMPLDQQPLPSEEDLVNEIMSQTEDTKKENEETGKDQLQRTT